MGEKVEDFRLQEQNQDRQDQQQPPHPPPHRRPRVREVSSRFMSPVVTSASSGDIHLVPSRSPVSRRAISNPTEVQQPRLQRSNSVRRQRHQDFDPSGCSDENRPDTSRSLDAPFGMHHKTAVSVQKKQRPGKFSNKENRGKDEQHQSYQDHCSRFYDNAKISVKVGNNLLVPRLDTPIPMASARLPSTTQSSKRSIQFSVIPTPQSTAAVKLLRSTGMSLSAQTHNSIRADRVNRASQDDETDGDRGSTEENDTGSCGSSPVDKCSTLILERNRPRDNTNVIFGEALKVSATPNSRSLNFPVCEQSPAYSMRPSEKPVTTLVKTSSGSMNMESVCLPPLPSLVKGETADGRKGRKVSTHQEAVHQLRLLHNHYLQWRFVIAKSETCDRSQMRETKKEVYCLGNKISELRDSVQAKRSELELFQRRKMLSTILAAQMPYLEEWSTLEEHYQSSLSEIVQALSDASLQLPMNGNLRVDIRGIGETFNSAVKVTELIESHVQCFVPKAEVIDGLASKLAMVIGGARNSVEECGDLLSRTFTSQVEECSLRSQLIQCQHSNNSIQP